jgi:lysophospholipase L1-like esterase
LAPHASRHVLLCIGCSLAACGGPPPAAPAPKPAPHFAPPSTQSAPTPPPVASQQPPSAAHCEPIVTTLPELISVDIDVPVPAIEDPEGRNLDAFHAKLARLLRGKATDHVRIGMYGDSNMTRDYITGEMRRTFQLRQGDAGHGFVSLGQPWSWYLHMDVRHGLDKDGWKSLDMSTDQVIDRLYGFAGIAAEAQRPNAVTWVATSVEPSRIGRTASVLDVSFLKRPKGGTFDIRVDGKVAATVDTKGDKLEAGFHTLEVDDAPHKFEFVSGPKGLVRLFGAALERKQPSIVVDSLGIGGVSMELIAKGDRAVAIQTVRRRKYDLIIFLMGATEAVTPGHAKAVEQLVALHREALPGAAIMLMSPPDLAGGPGKQPTLNPRVGQLAREKRRLALANGCAFWDFRAAMGGDLSIVRFTDRKMAWTDYIHLSEKGGTYMGRRIAYAIWRDLMGYLERHPDAGCE